LQALLDHYEGPADPSLGVFVTILAGNELRRTSVVTMQSGVAKFSEGDDFCVYLPDGQQWRSNSSLKIVLMGSAHAPEDGQFKGTIPLSLTHTHTHSLSLSQYLINVQVAASSWQKGVSN
jgi:hypothetical protein